MENHEALKSGAVFSQLSDSVQNCIDQFLANRVMSSRIIIRCVFFSSNQLFWVVQVLVFTLLDRVDDTWLQIDDDSSWDEAFGVGGAEEGRVAVVVFVSELRLIWRVRKSSVGVDSVLETGKPFSHFLR